jgi:hypothetical protein
VMVSFGLVLGDTVRSSRKHIVRGFRGISGRFFIHFPYRGSVWYSP